MGRPGCAQCCGQTDPGQISFRCACLHTKSGFPQGSGNLDDYWNIPLRFGDQGSIEEFPNPYFANNFGAYGFDPEIHPANEDKFEYILVIHNWNGQENDQFKMCFNGEDFGVVNAVTIDDYWTHVYGTSDEIIDHFLYGSDKGGGLNVGGVNMNLTPPRVPFDDAQPKTFFNRTIYKTVVDKAPFLMDANVYGQLYSGAFGVLDEGSFAFKFEKVYDEGKDVVVNATVLRFDLHTNPGPENFSINGNFRSKVDPDDDRTKDEYDFKTFTFAPEQEFYLACPLGGDIIQFCDTQHCRRLGQQDPCCPVVVEERNSSGQLTNTVPNEDCESIPELSLGSVCTCNESSTGGTCVQQLKFTLEGDGVDVNFGGPPLNQDIFYTYPSDVAQNHPDPIIRDLWNRLPDDLPLINTIFGQGVRRAGAANAGGGGGMGGMGGFGGGGGPGIPSVFIAEFPQYYFRTTPQTRANNTFPDCEILTEQDFAAGASIYDNPCSCCEPVDWTPILFDMNGKTKMVNPTRTFDPPVGTCTIPNNPLVGSDGTGLELRYTFQGIDFFVEVTFYSGTVPEGSIGGLGTVPLIQENDTICFGTVRTLTSFIENQACGICRIEQYPKRQFFGSAFSNLACSPDPFLGFQETPCPNCGDIYGFDGVPEGNFVYFDNKNKQCIEYVYDAQTGTYTVRIL